eukprot:COSAG02_NODE_2799_length_8009_cov_10.033375_2_plen_82_part_00
MAPRGTSSILASIDSQLCVYAGQVCLLIVFLLAILSLVGISSFGGALQYECIDADMNGDYICTEGQQQVAKDRYAYHSVLL